jgi:hypothetical protein
VRGNATADATPVARPLKKPLGPSDCAPAIGCATRDTAPANTPFPMDLVADDNPADTSFGLRVENNELNTSLACNFIIIVYDNRTSEMMLLR